LKLGRRAWRAKLDLAMKLWAELRPNDSQRYVGCSRNDFSFGSIRPLATNANFGEWVDGWHDGDNSWSFRVRGSFSDGRVMAMESDVVGYDVSGVHVLDFDVLEACSLMDGQPASDPPLVSIDASDAEVASHLADCCLRTDRIWAFFGGASIDNLPKLAIWMIQNRHAVVAFDVSVAMVCAAYVYGETELSLDLLTEYEMKWKSHIQAERRELSDLFDQQVPEGMQLLFSREQAEAIGARAIAHAVRLRSMITGGDA
jgi:hypothetical protein